MASGNLSLGGLQLKVGVEGFQSYLIPAVLILAGLLTWFTPAQRVFYGVLAALVSVYSLIGVNLGGFFIGMLLGVVGGALSASWAPVTPEQEPVSEDDDHTGDDEQIDTAYDEQQPAEEDAVAEGRAGRHRDTTMDDLLSGPLTDVLPTSTSSPIPQPRPARSGGAATETATGTGTAGGDEQTPGGG